MRRYLFLFIVVFLLSSCSTQTQRHNTDQLATLIAKVAKGLDKAKFMPVRVGWKFDYGLDNDAGLLNTYEYLRSIVSFKTLQGAVPLKIYLSGPHTDGKLNLKSKYTFGHYNPAFVEYFHAQVDKVISNKTFVYATRDEMVKYGLINKLKKLKQIYQYIAHNRTEFRKFKVNYKAMLENKTWPSNEYDGYRKYLPQTLNCEKYWNWAETDYYFWIRRDMDGTKKLWIGVIDDILNAYASKT